MMVQAQLTLSLSKSTKRMRPHCSGQHHRKALRALLLPEFDIRGATCKAVYLTAVFSSHVYKPENCSRGTERACSAELGCDELDLQRYGLKSLYSDPCSDW